MDFSAFFKRAGKSAAENSPTLMAALAVTGVATTAILAAKGAFKASETLRDEKENFLEGHTEGEYQEPTFKEKFDRTWVFYVPAACSAVLSIGSIICSHHISERRAMAMASAYTISQKAYGEYKGKVLEKFGRAKEQAVRDEIAADQVARTPIVKTKTFPQKEEGVIGFDEWSQRYFPGDMESIRAAVNDFNQQMLGATHSSLTEFWSLIGLGPTSESDNVGWNTDKLLEVDYTVVEEGAYRVIAIQFKNPPVHKYYRLYA